MTVKEKLLENDPYDQAITRHGILDYIRDYEVTAYLCGDSYDLELQYVFKGCIKVDYKSKVDPKYFSMDDRLLALSRQGEPGYPEGFVWGVKYADVYPGWTLEEDTSELRILNKLYEMKFHRIIFNTNAYDLSIIFHDVEVNEIKKVLKEHK